ncbi:MAG: VWA domain-containing protein [Bryobacteraceae bacterium]
MGTLPILLFAAVLAVAQEPTPTFSTGISQVRLDVQVADGKNVITGLTKDDFVVYDEGARQPVTYFGRDSEPVRLLLLLDVSGSMKKHVALMAATARHALQYLRPGDRVGVMRFSRNTKLQQEYTADLELAAREIQASVRSDDLGAGTAINTSLLEAIEYVRGYSDRAGDPKQREERRAILIVTDNLSLNYKATDPEVLRALYGADSVLNAIVVGRAERPLPLPAGTKTNPDFTPSDVFTLSEQSGGEAVKAERADAAFSEMLERIRTRYTLSYKAPESGAGMFRRVRVDLSPAARQRYPAAQVRHRNGYYSER